MLSNLNDLYSHFKYSHPGVKVGFLKFASKKLHLRIIGQVFIKCDIDTCDLKLIQNHIFNFIQLAIPT